MGFTAAGMFARYKSKLEQLDEQTSSTPTALTMGDQCLLWLFESITEEIQDNARAVGSDSDGDGHELEIV